MYRSVRYLPIENEEIRNGLAAHLTEKKIDNGVYDDILVVGVWYMDTVRQYLETHWPAWYEEARKREYPSQDELSDRVHARIKAQKQKEALGDKCWCVGFKRKSDDKFLGAGQPQFYDVAKTWVDAMNKEWPDFHHFAFYQREKVSATAQGTETRARRV